jgi:hypothetical protein
MEREPEDRARVSIFPRMSCSTPSLAPSAAKQRDEAELIVLLRTLSSAPDPRETRVVVTVCDRSCCSRWAPATKHVLVTCTAVTAPAYWRPWRSDHSSSRSRRRTRPAIRAEAWWRRAGEPGDLGSTRARRGLPRGPGADPRRAHASPRPFTGPADHGPDRCGRGQVQVPASPGRRCPLRRPRLTTATGRSHGRRRARDRPRRASYRRSRRTARALRGSPRGGRANGASTQVNSYIGSTFWSRRPA